MEFVVALILVLIVLWFVVGRGSVGALGPSCPPGYVRSPVQSTWAGWDFECVPSGLGNARIPSDSLTRPLATVYAPVVADTGVQKLCFLNPAKALEFPDQGRGKVTSYTQSSRSKREVLRTIQGAMDTE
jgi:hypothetical protein